MGVPVIPGTFDYHAPTTLPAALALLKQYGDEAKPLAGGHSLIPLMRFRLAQPAHVIDLARIDGLAYIQDRDGYLCLGAMTPEVELETSDLIAATYPILADAAAVVADPLVRNAATIGGNLAHADPANDHPAVMLAVRAEIVALNDTGQRVIPIDRFFVDTFTTSLAEGELLTEIRIPLPTGTTGGAYEKLERKVGDYAIAGVAAQLGIGADGRIERAGIGLTTVGPMPIRATQAETSLIGATPDDAAIAQAAMLAAQQAEPVGDSRGPADYKRAIVRTLATRALRRALDRASA